MQGCEDANCWMKVSSAVYSHIRIAGTIWTIHGARWQRMDTPLAAPRLTAWRLDSKCCVAIGLTRLGRESGVELKYLFHNDRSA